MNPKPQVQPAKLKTKLKNLFTKVMVMHKLVAAELKLVWLEQYIDAVKIEPIRSIAAVQQTIENLAVKIELEKWGSKIIVDFGEVFAPIPHVNCLPVDVCCSIELKDTMKTIMSKSYLTLQKYCDTWKH